MSENQQEQRLDIKGFLTEKIRESALAKSIDEPLPFLDWLEMLKEDPSLGQLAHARMNNIIESHGHTEINRKTDPRLAHVLGLDGDESLMVPKFFGRFYGIESTVVEIANYFYIAAGQGEASRQMLYLYGPPGSGKSTLAEFMRRTLEQYEFWQLEGCDHHDNPINLIPRHLRQELLEKFGIYVDPRADICTQCRQKLMDDFKNDYSKFRVEKKKFSQRKGCGIAVVSEVDPINFNMAVLIGEEDISLLGVYKRGDPRTLIMSGAFSRGQRGWIELVEVFKNPIEAQRPLITLTQEKYVPLPKFVGQVYVDTIVAAHSNEEEWNRFKDDKSNEAIMDRIYIVRAPYNLRLTEEVQIYKDSFLGKSLNFRNMHIDPHTLELVAMFILFTRLSPSEKYDFLTKIRCYDARFPENDASQKILTELEDEADSRQGMVGLSYRIAMKEIIERSLALYRHRWQKDINLREKGGYLNPIWIMKTMVRYAKRADIPESGDWPKPSRERWLTFIQDELHKELMARLSKDIIAACITSKVISVEERANLLFKKYISNASAYVSDGNFSTEVLRTVERHLTLTMTPAELEAFRRELVQSAMDLKAKKQRLNWQVNSILKDAIEKEVIQIAIEDIVDILDKDQERKKVIAELKNAGYAGMGAHTILNYVKNHLGRD